MFTGLILFLVFVMLMTLLAMSIAGMLIALLSGGDPVRMLELFNYIRGLFKHRA